MESVNAETSAKSPSQSAPPTTAAAGTRFSLDASHSTVGFSVRHMMISNVRGAFERFSGEVVYDAARPEASRVTATIEVASINTREEKRDAHLRSAEFFDAEGHPSITFVSKRIRKAGDGLEVVGDLTIRGTTHEVVLAVQDITPEHTDPWGGRRVGATARTKIRRSDFGMQWNAALEAGGVLVGDEIKIEIEAQLLRQ